MCKCLPWSRQLCKVLEYDLAPLLQCAHFKPDFCTPYLGWEDGVNGVDRGGREGDNQTGYLAKYKECKEMVEPKTVVDREREIFL